MIGMAKLSQAIRENELSYIIEPPVFKVNPLKSRVNPLMLLNGKRGFICIKIRVYRHVKIVDLCRQSFFFLLMLVFY